MQLPLRIRLKVSAQALRSLLQRPSYVALAAAGTLLTFLILIWLTNLKLLFYVVFQSSLPLYERLIFPLRSFTSLATTFTTVQAVTLVLLALVQGIIIAVLVYVLRRRRLNASGLAAGGGSMVIAAFGLGCTTCGTSLLSPILSALAAGSAAAIGAIIAPIINVASIILGLYALMKLSHILATEQAKEQL